MPEVVVDQPVVGSESVVPGDQHVQAPGWLAGLPADLRDNEAFKSYRTVGDFAKAHLDTAAKAKEYEGKLANSIPKLGENATQEERDKFYTSLGRPEKPDGYGLTKGSKNAPEWDKYWENALFENGVPLNTAQGLKKSLDVQMTKMVEQHNAAVEAKKAADLSEVSTKLKTELGDKYDAGVELASRLWKRDTDSDLEKIFEGQPPANKLYITRYILKVAAKTGEDSSLRGTGQRQTAPATSGYDLSKFNLPPARV